MIRSFRVVSYFLVFTAILLVAFSGSAQQPSDAPPVPVTTVVTVLGPKFTPPPVIEKNEVTVYEGGVKQDVTGWVPAKEKAPLELAILIDDGSDTDLSVQFGDLKKFIEAQPPTTKIALYYADNGTVRTESAFSADHEAVAKKLRIPRAENAGSIGVYVSLMDLFKKWPATTARREVLVIADGIDRLRGDPFSPDVPETVEHAEKAGIVIHSIYAKGVGYLSRNQFRISYGQSNLAQLADGTGGEAFFEGFQTPVSFEPYLQELSAALGNQYLLTFDATRSKNKKGDFRHFVIRVEPHNVDVASPNKIFVSGQ